MLPLPYPIDPFEVYLSDGVLRRLRFTAGALRRGQKDLSGMDRTSEPVPFLVVMLWHGLLDKDGIADQDALAELIDTRGIDYLNERVSLALTDAKPKANPTTPASAL